MKETAEKNNVSGWVKNLPDKRVEAVLEGEESSVDAMVDWSSIGPPGGVVDDLQIIEENYKGEFANFEILY
jgi:acylphosphatase